MNSNIVVPENMVSAVLEKASRLYQVQQTDNSYTLEQMMAGGSEVEIPPELMQQAYLEVQKEFQAAALQAKQQQKMLKIGGIAAAAFLGIATLWTIGTYNALNTALGSVDGKWAQVENQMQRRADLIPQLTNIADGFADREAAVITSLNDSRQAFIEANTVAERSAADEEMKEAIANFQTYAASNPQLQSSELFVNLQYEVAGTENRIATERMRYNQAVEDYNRSVKSFPTVMVAGWLGFEPQAL